MQLTGVRNVLQACKEESVSGAPLEPLAAVMQRIADERGGDGSAVEVARLILEQVASHTGSGWVITVLMRMCIAFMASRVVKEQRPWHNVIVLATPSKEAHDDLLN